MTDQSPQYPVTVEGVGEFLFARRNMRNNIAIGVETQRLSEGVELDDWLGIFVTAMSTLKVLTISAPPKWNLDELDPFEVESYSRVIKVWEALRQKEEGFRRGPQVAVSGGGEGVGEQPRVLVPPEVLAGADGP